MFNTRVSVQHCNLGTIWHLNVWYAIKRKKQETNVYDWFCSKYIYFTWAMEKSKEAKPKCLEARLVEYLI